MLVSEYDYAALSRIQPRIPRIEKNSQAAAQRSDSATQIRVSNL
jgi:hypothetical protein